jgi:hypothetical protein
MGRVPELEAGAYGRIRRINPGGATMAFTVTNPGHKIRVNGTGLDDQEKPSIAALPNGRWVVTWTGLGPKGWGVYQQVYSGNGTPLFTQDGKPVEHVVNAAPSIADNSSDVSVEAFGTGWIVTWTKSTGVNKDVFMQVFDENGNSQIGGGNPPTDVRVNQETLGSQLGAKITTLGSDGWLVTWIDINRSGIYQQRYNAAGEPQYLSEQRINPLPILDNKGIDVAAINGGFAVVWAQRTALDAPLDIYLQLLDPTSGQTRNIKIGTAVIESMAPRIKALPGGDEFLVVWSDLDSEGSGVWMQKFSASGASVAEPFLVNSIEAGNQTDPSIDVFADGSWIVTFTSGYDVLQRRFDKDGEPQGFDRLTAAWLGSDLNRMSDVAVLDDGRWVAAWTNFNQGDDAANGIAQRVFSLSGTAELTAALDSAHGTDDAETLEVRNGTLSLGDRLIGGGGIDTLKMIEAGTLNLYLSYQFDGIESIQGSGEADRILTEMDSLVDVLTIDGGDGNDELLLSWDSDFDLTELEIVEIEKITVDDGKAAVTVDDVATGLLIWGKGTDDKVILSGDSFAIAERYQLFSQGVETVQDKDGTYVKGLG